MAQSAISTDQWVDAQHAPPHLSAAWRTLSLNLIDAQLDRHVDTFADHTIALNVSGRHRNRQEVAGRGRLGRSWRGHRVSGQGRGPLRGECALARNVPFAQDAFLSRVIATTGMLTLVMWGSSDNCSRVTE